jgi:long-chain acyl-CoA synthetase
MMLSFTSGTTGQSKAVRLTHYSLIACIAGGEYSNKIGPNDSSLSYLPNAHVAGIWNLNAHLYAGGKHGFYSGDPLQIVSDAQALKPTVFGTVPRLMAKIHEKITNGVK